MTPTWLMVVCAALSACGPTGPSDLLDANAWAESDAVTSGATGLVRVEVVNLGLRAVEIDVVTCPPRVLVFDPDGDLVEQPSVSCLLALSAPVALAPGQAHVYTQGWLARDAHGTPLAPGTYRIRAWAVPIGGDPVLTNRVTVRVRAPE